MRLIIKSQSDNTALEVTVSEEKIKVYFNFESNEYSNPNPKYSMVYRNAKAIQDIYNHFYQSYEKELKNSYIEYMGPAFAKELILDYGDSQYSFNTAENYLADNFCMNVIRIVTPVINAIKNDPKPALGNIASRLLSFVNGPDYKRQKIDFEWPLESTLRNVSDKSLELVLQMLAKSKYTLKKDGKNIILNTNVDNVCDNTLTTDDLLNDLDNHITDKPYQFRVPESLTVDRICIGCKFQRCPKHLMAFIHYLASTSKLEKMLLDREKNLNPNELYTFDWKYNEVFKYIPDEVYNFANEYYKKGLIYITRYLKDGRTFELRSPFGCADFKIKKLNINEYETDEKEIIKWRVINRNPNNSHPYMCSNKICGLPACVWEIAGLIKYLTDSGRENEITEQRQYYHEHQEECQKHYLEEIEKEKENYNKQVAEDLQALNEYKDYIANLSSLIATFEKKNYNNLFITVEGKEQDEKNRFISILIDVLRNSNRISDNNGVIRTSLFNLAAKNSYIRSVRDGEDRDFNRTLYRSQEELITTVLKRDHLYVVGGIKEFIDKYKIVKNKKEIGSYLEIRKKQFENVLELLSDIRENYYIILDGTTEEIESLFEIDQRISYVYQDNRYVIPECSLENAFVLFMKGLDNSLLDELQKDTEKYKQEFFEYISVNKQFIPFDNRELAMYLASYCNNKNELILPDDIYKKETVAEALENIIGLDTVKENVKKFEKYMLFKMKAESSGINLASTNLHMIFTGNPGTGKTTVARIMAKMLYDMGVIKENKLIEVERKDLVASYMGQTAVKTSEVIDKAMGGVLFVDEAYSLHSESGSDYGKEAIATLIKAMEDHKDELIVIFAGYRKEMYDFLEINPGISSRIGYKFDFPDYSVPELLQIFDKKISKMGFEVDPECKNKLKEVFEYFSKRKAFGNGRFVDKVIQEVLLNHSTKDNKDIKLIVSEDVPSISELNHSNDNIETTEELLKGIIGLDDLKQKIHDFEDYVVFVSEARKKGLSIPNQNMNMIFTGNPGCGKTTIARIMTKILYNAGIIHDNLLVEVERKDLVAEYVGQTATKTSAVVDQAMGGVLFIDEAYSLYSGSGNDFGKEAVATLIKAMEDHRGEFVVIFAGYKKEMADFIEMNSGISSRIGYIFDFPDYTREELAEILYLKIDKSGLKISDTAKEKVSTLMNYFANVENIGNGRFADKVFQELLLKHARNKNENIELIDENDIPSISEMTDTLFDGKNMINPDTITEQSLRKTATHEIGHALIRYKLFDSPNIVKITINAEGSGALGYVRYKTNNEPYTSSKSHLLKRIMVSLGGMASEEIFYGEFENGNSSDLEKATNIARGMVMRYGMSKMGLGVVPNTQDYNPDVQKEINDMLQECFEKTKQIISENKEKMQKVIDYLLEHKEIDEETFIKEFNS